MRTHEMTPAALVDLFETMVQRRHELSSEALGARDRGIKIIRGDIIARMSEAIPAAIDVEVSL